MSRDWNEAEHPRWPAETPGGKGGEFRGDAPGGWLDQAAGGLLAGFMTHNQIAAYREREDYEVFDVGGSNAGSSMIHGREYPDGTRLVVKQHEYDESAYNEYVASHIGWAIGAPVPAVVGDLQHADTTWSQYVVGDVANTRIHGWSTWDEFAEKQSELAMSLRGSFELGLFDYLIHNTDRHAGNWIVTPPAMLHRVPQPAKVVGIDHGHADIVGNSLDSISSPFSEWIFSDFGSINDLTGAITGAELDVISFRIASLEADGIISRPEMDRLLRKIRDLKRHTR